MSQSHRCLAAALALVLALAALPAYAAPGGTVNVNMATVDQLQLLPRIGPAVAQRIVEHREKNGAFKSLEDLMLVRGIGESTFEQIKPYVALSGATTLAEKVQLPRQAKSAPPQRSSTRRTATGCSPSRPARTRSRSRPSTARSVVAAPTSWCSRSSRSRGRP